MHLTFCILKKKKIYLAYVSKHNSNREKQVIILMTSKGKKFEAQSERRLCHYLSVKKLSALLRGITSQRYGGFYYINYYYFFRTKTKLHIKKYLKIKIFIIL